MLVDKQNRWVKRSTHIVLAVLLIMYIHYRLTPAKVYSLSPSTTSEMRIYPQEDSVALHVYHATEDTTIYETYLVDGYVGSDTASVKKIILSFLYFTQHKNVLCKKINFKDSLPVMIIDTARVDLSRKTVKYYFKFYKSTWGVE